MGRKKLDLTEEERKERRREICKKSAKKYYENNREVVSEKQHERYIEKSLIKNPKIRRYRTQNNPQILENNIINEEVPLI